MRRLSYAVTCKKRKVGRRSSRSAEAFLSAAGLAIDGYNLLGAEAIKTYSIGDTAWKSSKGGKEAWQPSFFPLSHSTKTRGFQSLSGKVERKRYRQ